MSTVKISELPIISTLGANTSNLIFVAVDLETDVTGRISATAALANLTSNVTGAFIKANSAYDSQNTTGVYANSAFVKANSAYDSQNVTGTYANSAFVKANSAYDSQNTTGTYANSAFVKANSAFDSQNVTGTYANSAFSAANSGGLYANSAFVKANSAFDSQNVTGTYANSAFGAANSAGNYANSAFVEANSAYAKANSALANTTGLFDGALTISNNLNVNGIVKIANTGFSATQAALTISATSAGITQTPGGDGYMLHITGKDNVPTRIVADSFGANGQLVFPIFGGRAARGNVTHPSAVQTNDVLTRIGAGAYGATSYISGGTARIDFIATENHTDTARGTAIKIYNIENGSNVLTNIATINANDVIFTGTVTPQRGFIYTPNVQSTLTSIGIDFSRDNLVKFNVNDNATITLSNYVYGKVVEVWITNSAAQNKTITHGCLANNSTSKLTTFTITSLSSAYLRYFSIDGDQANTFVSIIA